MARASTNKREILRNACFTLATYIVNIVAAFIISPVLVHGLGDQAYGVWSLIESFLAYLSLADLGLRASILRYVARFEAAQDPGARNRVFSTTFMVLVATGFVVLVITAGAALCWQRPLGVPPDLVTSTRYMLLLLGFNLAVGLPLGCFSTVLQSLGRYPVSHGTRAALVIGRTVVLYAAMRGGGGLVAVGLILTAFNIFEGGVMVLAAWCYLPDLRLSLACVDRETFRLLWGYSLDALLAMIAGRINFQTDALVIGAFLAPQYITFFVVGAKLVDYARTFAKSIATVITPAVSRLEARGDYPAIRRAFVTGSRWILFVSLPIECGLIIFGRQFLAVWLGPHYAQLSYPTLVILTLPPALLMCQAVSDRILYGIGKIRWYSRFNMVQAALNLGLSVALVRPMGIEGVAWGTSVPNLICTIAIAIYTCHVTQTAFLTYLRQAFLKPVLAVVMPALTWEIMLSRYPIEHMQQFFIIGFVGMAAYLPVVLILEFGPAGLVSRLRNCLAARGGWAAQAETACVPAAGQRAEGGERIRGHLP